MDYRIAAWNILSGFSLMGLAIAEVAIVCPRGQVLFVANLLCGFCLEFVPALLGKYWISSIWCTLIQSLTGMVMVVFQLVYLFYPVDEADHCDSSTMTALAWSILGINYLTPIVGLILYWFSPTSSQKQYGSVPASA